MSGLLFPFFENLLQYFYPYTTPGPLPLCSPLSFPTPRFHHFHPCAAFGFIPNATHDLLFEVRKCTEEFGFGWGWSENRESSIVPRE